MNITVKNARAVQAVKTEAVEARRLRRLTRLRKQLERFAAILPPLDDSAPFIRRDRER